MAAEGRNAYADSERPIRVLLADDHTMFRQGLARILASHGGMEVVAEVPNDAEALRLARDLEPDVVVMQVQMPFSRAIETLEAMRSFHDPPKVVICTMFERPRYVRDLTGVGLNAYVIKTSSAEHLVAAIRAAVLDPKSENAVIGKGEGYRLAVHPGLHRNQNAHHVEPPGPWETDTGESRA